MDFSINNFKIDASVVQDFQRLPAKQKIAVVIGTLVAAILTFGIAASLAFRSLVGRFTVIDKNSDQTPAASTVRKTDSAANEILHNASPSDSAENDSAIVRDTSLSNYSGNEMLPFRDASPARYQVNWNGVSGEYIGDLQRVFSGDQPAIYAKGTLTLPDQIIHIDRTFPLPTHADPRNNTIFNRRQLADFDSSVSSRIGRRLALPAPLAQSQIETDLMMKRMGLSPEQTDFVSYLEREAAQPITYHELVLMLRSTFGSKMADLVIEKFTLEEGKEIQPELVENIRLFIATTVRTDYLKELFDLIKEGKSEHRRILAPLKMEEYRELQSVESFEDLTAAQLESLHALIERVLRENEPIISNSGLVMPQTHCKRDNWKHLNLMYDNLAIAEFLGKTMAYEDLEINQAIFLPNEDKARVNYHVAGRVFHVDNGFVSYLFSPVNSQQILRPKESPLFLVFRGSKNVESFHRDFNGPRGIGRNEYEKFEGEVRTMLEANLKREEETLEISGHSLGACDAQRALVTVLEAIAGSEEGSEYRKIQKITLTTHNSPGANPTLNHRLKDAVKLMQEKGIKVELHINHILFEDNGYADVVQSFGDVYLGAEKDGYGEPNTLLNYGLKRNVYRVSLQENNRIYGVKRRHSRRVFDLVRDGNASWLVTSIEDQEQMEKILARNYYWDPNCSGVTALVKGTQWYLSYGGRQTIRGIRIVAQPLVRVIFNAVKLVKN